MVDYVVWLFVVERGYCQVAMMLCDLLHDSRALIHQSMMSWSKVPIMPSAALSCPLSHILFTAVCSHVFRHQTCQDLIWYIKACNWTVILFVAKVFCFWKQNSFSRWPPLRNHCCIDVQVCEYSEISIKQTLVGCEKSVCFMEMSAS